jgi:hypothetical protein
MIRSMTVYELSYMLANWVWLILTAHAEHVLVHLDEMIIRDIRWFP